MKNKNELSSLAAQLSRARSHGPSLAQLLSANTAAEHTRQSLSAHFQKVASSRDSSKRSANAAPVSKPGLKFGTLPGSKAGNSSQGSSEWSNLLTKTASGGLSSAFGGGLLSAVGGLGSLVSSIVGLFGGGSKKTLPVLTAFDLPGSQNQSLVVGSHSTESKGSPNTQPAAIYGAAQHASTVVSIGEQTYQYQSAHSAQAVKLALLNSSSLNDVIAEL